MINSFLCTFKLIYLYVSYTASMNIVGRPSASTVHTIVSDDLSLPVNQGGSRALDRLRPGVRETKLYRCIYLIFHPLLLQKNLNYKKGKISIDTPIMRG